MKLAILFDPYTCPKPLDFNNLFTSSRGLSGSDLGVVRIASEMAKFGHDVSLFTIYIDSNQPKVWQGIKLYKTEEKYNIINNGNFDAVISWSVPDALRGLDSNLLRITYDMLNGFTYCSNGFQEFTDQWIFVSEPHKDYNLSFNLIDHKKISVIPLGCDLDVYSGEKVPGRMIWASSAERGLFNLLSVWPEIRKAVPTTHLRIFYDFNTKDIENLEKGVCENPNAGPQIYEVAQRTRWMTYAMSRLESFGIEKVGSVSRERINKEMSEAMVMAYPCDPVAWTEGFSCSTLESAAARACPILSKADALENIYGNHIPTFNIPQDLIGFKDCVIKALTDEEYRNSINEKAYEFAKKHTWEQTAKKLEQLITSHPKFGKKEKPIEINTPSNQLTNSNQLVKLNLGCGTNVLPYDHWLNFDNQDFSEYFNFIQTVQTSNGMPDHQKELWQYCQNGGKINFQHQDITQRFNLPDDSVDLIVFLQTIEHFNPVYEIPNILKEIYRILKPGGLVRISTPDLDLLINNYLNNKMDEFNNDQPEYYKNADQSSKLSYIMFGSGGPSSTSNGKYEGHHFLFTKKSLVSFLKTAGFNNIFLTETNKSKNLIIEQECVDTGTNHSLIMEAVK